MPHHNSIVLDPEQERRYVGPDLVPKNLSGIL